MLPMVGVPDTLRLALAAYRDVFGRAEGFDPISRYLSGLILSPNKTLQGIDDLQVWEPTVLRSRRARHEAVFEAGWAAERLMPHHREVLAGLSHKKSFGNFNTVYSLNQFRVLRISSCW